MLHYNNVARTSKTPAKIPPPITKAEVIPESFKLKKRDCETFRVARGPYSVSGGNDIVSDTVSYGQTEPCSATLGNSVTESFGINVSVSVGDAPGIFSASVRVSYEMSVERSFMGRFMFDPVVSSVFAGDCDGNGQQVVACGPTRSAGEMTGDLRAVLIRG
ncbi:hypothetical protein Slin15195_G004030 [Septoria linicola]|uniref:Uncharacterized protein n=1 Tax=Septoria linicola TaxID=215465 RepID=A0A9Q9EEM8_9PEZI|nr:hypothetical protein Slin14017_G004060 [Septoria linicola]USW47084.1 hypothetical protein Slin15195_G004030 [Septoria linicola]